MYESTTRDIRITVRPVYLEEQSAPHKDHYVWAYTVTIVNQGLTTVQLVSRYWNITDALGRVTEVQGEGVIGEKPVLDPGEDFEYTSGTPLSTASGIMRGTYTLETPEGSRFKVDIPAFSLDSPYMRRSLN
jgi:ApaG protein